MPFRARTRKDEHLRLPFLPLIFLALPLAEIAGFVIVGSEIGVLATIALILATTVLGAICAHRASTDVAHAKRLTGVSPGRDMVHAVMIMLAGALSSCLASYRRSPASSFIPNARASGAISSHRRGRNPEALRAPTTPLVADDRSR